MTDNEIIKALECCADNSEEKCRECPFHKLKISCIDELERNAFDLINRLKEDVEELEAIVDLRSKRKYYQKFVTEVYQKEKGNELSTPDFDYIYELYFKQKAEIERLKSDSENQSVLWRNHFESIFESAKETIKAEAIKEFAERLKEAFSDLEFEYDPKLRIVKVEEVKSLVDWALHKISIETIQDVAKDISGN